MRTVIRIVATKMVASRAGRWALTAILLVLGAAGLASYPVVSQTESATDGLSFLVAGIVFIGLGIAMLVISIRFDRLQRAADRVKKIASERVNELQARGLIFPIPGLPSTPAGLSQQDVTTVETYAVQMAKLPWGDHPPVSLSDAEDVFNRTVAKVRRTRGNWDMLREPIDAFLTLRAG